MTRAGLLRLLVVVGFVLGVELLCWIGVIDRLTMTPPSGMV